MKSKRTKRNSKAQTVRLDEESTRAVESFARATGWSTSRVINQLIVAAVGSMVGDTTPGKALFATIHKASIVLAHQERSNKELAKLRKAERDAAAKIKPVHLAELPHQA
jgi:hypothetical protein